MIIEKNSGKKVLCQNQRICSSNISFNREIGSEFWNIPLALNTNSLFSKNTKWLLSGRSALQAIVKNMAQKENISVAMPSLCCDSMVKPFIDARMAVRFYPVYVKQGHLVQKIDYNCDVLFLMDYFGYTDEMPDLGSYSGIVIRDVTHSVFSKTYNDADYYFGSLRKWCGFWTGGFAWAKDGRQFEIADGDDKGYTLLRKKAMELKDCYINRLPDKNGNLINDKGYLSVYEEAEEILEDIGVAAASERDIKYAKKLDVEFMKTQRRKNAKILMQAFADQLIFPTLHEDDCPMFVPILVPEGKRNELRRYLIQRDIYCPVHWPVSPYHKLQKGPETDLYDNELSLVCDQRYTEQDMFRMVEAIHEFWKEN